jgi:hypothetical protein
LDTPQIVARRSRPPDRWLSEPVLARAFEYWTSIAMEIGDRIEQAIRNG